MKNKQTNLFQQMDIYMGFHKLLLLCLNLTELT